MSQKFQKTCHCVVTDSPNTPVIFICLSHCSWAHNPPRVMVVVVRLRYALLVTLSRASPTFASDCIELTSKKPYMHYTIQSKCLELFSLFFLCRVRVLYKSFAVTIYDGQGRHLPCPVAGTAVWTPTLAALAVMVGTISRTFCSVWIAAAASAVAAQ